MEFDSRDVKFKPIDESDIAVLGFSTDSETARKQPIGSIMSDAEILRDLDGVIQTGQDDDLQGRSICGCGDGCSCSGSTCSCGSKKGSDSFVDHAFEDVGDSFFELFNVMDSFSSQGSARFDQDSMQEFVTIAEQALENLFDSLKDSPKG